MLVHQHYIFRGSTKMAIREPKVAELWLRSLVELINMKILMGPFATYCEMKGNKGITALVAIETSHIALHMWDERNPPSIELDVYSCKEYDINKVLNYIENTLGIEYIDFQLVNRN